MLSPFTPYPPDSGGRIRQWEFIKCLGKRHDLTLVFFINRGEEKMLQGAFDGICSRVETVTHAGDVDLSGPQSLPWPMRAYGVDAMKKLLSDLSADRYDLLLIDFIYMAQHRFLFDIPAVLHEHNIESSLYKQYAELPNVKDMEIFGLHKEALFWKATWMLMRQYENKIWPAFDLRLTVSRLDQMEMESRCPDGKTIVAENGVSTQGIRLLPASRSKKILFVGTMNYFPNVDGALFMVQSIMPLVWQRDPDIRLCIAGREIPRHIREFGADSRIEIVSDFPDIHDIAAGCCLSVVPLRLGGGTRIKILEAFALGLPVVSTAKGCEGLAIEDGRHLIVRDEPDAFAEAVALLANDPQLADSLRGNGRRLVEERYDWQKIFEAAEEQMVRLVQA